MRRIERHVAVDDTPGGDRRHRRVRCVSSRSSTSRYDDPVLVSSTDGVGTKAMIATPTGRFDTVGIDLVAMCVDDIACQGAEPLWFLDYISVGQLDPEQVEALVAGVADGCRQAGCALIGGEMAEHPGAMAAGEFDLVGFAVGVVERAQSRDPDRVQAGDVLLRRCRRPVCARTATRSRGACSSTSAARASRRARVGRAHRTHSPTSCCARR